jgi:HD-like signal output (HDOD) protein
MPESLAKPPHDSAAALLGGVRQLPPLPDAATEIVTSLTDEFVTLEKVAEILEKDPALTARLLGLANSAFYSQKQEVSTVRDAGIRPGYQFCNVE